MSCQGLVFASISVFNTSSTSWWRMKDTDASLGVNDWNQPKSDSNDGNLDLTDISVVLESGFLQHQCLISCTSWWRMKDTDARLKSTQIWSKLWQFRSILVSVGFQGVDISSISVLYPAQAGGGGPPLLRHPQHLHLLHQPKVHKHLTKRIRKWFHIFTASTLMDMSTAETMTECGERYDW